MMNIRDREILRLAIPSIVTNVTVPLLGLVDLAIVGHIGNETLIGAIAVGSMIFNVMYWLMGFLRMGTSGMTAQAFGQSLAANNVPILAILRRNLLVAVAIAVTFVVLQTPLQWLSLWLMEPSQGVASLVRVYFNICIWGAPAVLSLYVMTGWFIGMQDTRTPMRAFALWKAQRPASSPGFMPEASRYVSLMQRGPTVRWVSVPRASAMPVAFVARRRSQPGRSVSDQPSGALWFHCQTSASLSLSNSSLSQT